MDGWMGGWGEEHTEVASYGEEKQKTRLRAEKIRGKKKKTTGRKGGGNINYRIITVLVLLSCVRPVISHQPGPLQLRHTHRARAKSPACGRKPFIPPLLLNSNHPLDKGILGGYSVLVRKKVPSKSRCTSRQVGGKLRRASRHSTHSYN